MPTESKSPGLPMPAEGQRIITTLPFHDPDEGSSVDEGNVAFGCQIVPMKHLLRIAKLVSKIRKK